MVKVWENIKWSHPIEQGKLTGQDKDVESSSAFTTRTITAGNPITIRHSATTKLRRTQISQAISAQAVTIKVHDNQDDKQQ
ncbi:unnamed protein product [Anisakis simplex]|uniref:Hva1_TUDOR domain-containing protein n=1 Tax=Anisakis simplex TaxID=6269 RepID=A0A0M3J1N3_ANISI|nr:unnamed protein product [Anisakis simplex]